MNRSTRTAVQVGGAGVASVGIIAAAIVVLSDDATSRVPSNASFSIMDRPQNATDRAAIKSFKGTPLVEIRNARLLGTDKRNHHRLITVEDRQVCLVEIASPEASNIACDSPEDVAREGLWLKSGGEVNSAGQMEYALSVLISDEYSDADVAATGKVVEREKNLLVVASARGRSDSVSLKSNRYRDLTITAPSD